MAEERQDARTTPPGRRFTVSEAAGALGISAEAVRSRLKRGTLRSVKDGATVYVLLTPDQSRPDADQTPPEPDQTGDQTELVDALRDQVAYLREQLAVRDEEIRRRDHLLASALERMPALEASREPPQSPTPSPERQEAETGTQRRPWWRRVFGG
jgi:hypothetical protein